MTWTNINSLISDEPEPRPQVLPVPHLLDGVGPPLPGPGQHGLPQGLHGAVHGLGVGPLRRGVPRHLHSLVGGVHDHQGGLG